MNEEIMSRITITDEEMSRYLSQVSAISKGMTFKDVAYMPAKKVDDDTYLHAISSEARDRDGDVVTLSGWDFRNFRNNPVVLWSHNDREPAIGKNVSLRKADGLVWAKTMFAMTPFAQGLRSLVDEGILSSWSVRFIGKEKERIEDDIGGYKFLAHELVEYSLCNIGANPDARFYRALKCLSDEVIDHLGTKGATPASDYALDMNAAWDAAGARRQLITWAGGPDKEKIDWAKYRKGFFWYDSSEPENIGSYKMPFVFIRNGKPTAIWRGVTAAMGALLGARGGVDIPAADRKAVYNHIARYYRKAEKEPPDFKVFSDSLMIEIAKYDEDELMDILLSYSDKYALLKSDGQAGEQPKADDLTALTERIKNVSNIFKRKEKS